MNRTSRSSQRARLAAALVPWLAIAMSISACATAGERGDFDAGVKEPLRPDASPGNEPFSATLYLRGTFNDFDTSRPFTYEGNNRYTVVAPLGAGSHELKIADEAFSSGSTFAVATDRAAAIELDVPTALVPASGPETNVLLFVPQTGTYRFELSATDRASPVLLISLLSPAPYGNALYVRGSFNEFGVSTPLPYEGDNRYLAELGLEAGTHQFKIADSGFSDTNTFAVSATEAAALSLDVPTPLVLAPGTGNDIVLELAQAGTYRFELIASSPATPVLQVSQVSAAPYRAPLYLRGTFNDFDASLALQYRGDDRYTAVVALDTGTHGFKIADLDFTDEFTFSVDAAQGGAIELDQPTDLVPAPGAGNETTLAIAEPGTYEFALTATPPQQPVLLVRRIAPAPYPVDLYVLGSFNDFDAIDRLRYQGENRYVAVVALPAGEHELKIADASFSDQTTFSVDSTRASSIALDTPTALEPAVGAGNNTLLSITQAGSYRFELTADEAAAPVLTVSQEIALFE
jgi:hypothetical protein